MPDDRFFPHVSLLPQVVHAGFPSPGDYVEYTRGRVHPVLFSGVRRKLPSLSVFHVVLVGHVARAVISAETRLNKANANPRR